MSAVTVTRCNRGRERRHRYHRPVTQRPEPRPISTQTARRMAVQASLLSGPVLPADTDGILSVVRGLGYLQLDPTRVVERSHLLVVWSRLGAFDRSDLERLQWEGRRLFEYDAFIVPTEDYPWQQVRMRHFALSEAAYERRARAWMEENDAFRRRLLEQLRSDGPLPSRAFSAGPEVTPWRSGGWTAGRNVTQMLHFLERAGQIMVSRRDGNERVWDLPERVLPSWTPREALPEEDLLPRWIERLVRRRGVADPVAIPQRVSFADRATTRAAIADLLKAGRLLRLTLEDGSTLITHADDLPLLKRIEAGEWEPRTMLLSPFDPLIADRERTERLFGFRYRLEIYVPKAKREYGYFVMPILHGDRLIGRIEPVMDRSTRRLTVRSISFEPSAGARPPELDDAIASLATFLGAD